MKPKVIAIVGPTASGKTKMAIDLAKQLDGEIVSADSRLVYKGFDIASAKPTLEERDGVPHHLIDIVEPEFDYSAGNYCDDARAAIYDILNRGKTPIVAGGTGLYFRVLLENYDLPRVEANQQLRDEFNLREREDLLEEVKRLDPVSYERLFDSNKRRIVRALEVMKILGKPFSEVSGEKEPEFDVEWRMPYIESREVLYERINKRVDIMVEQGLIEETQNLLKKHGRIKNFVCTIGYREVLTYLDGEATLEEALDKLKQHTRNYAKRQLTWFRANPELEFDL
ncbi:MAG: tRNA (adenosine(37)-N6)-dimethylallyltransferase MiaA [Candidatus Gastranaerophilales bacterium]|nr:tRNA (adenosine(37)-N6)-dimethylallyltransferase MiaA [Candidatus Gastranaerophilales bacterium]MCM1073638.1 tRNA (adenosine(37)-N6)-dimethylallyltransferase MiaA [Bacteroides sp.]